MTERARPRQLPLFEDEDAGRVVRTVRVRAAHLPGFERLAGESLPGLGPQLEGFRSRREAWRHRLRTVEVVALL